MSGEINEGADEPANLIALAHAVPQAPAPIDFRQTAARETPYVAFDRHELSEILKIYGRMVAAGEWRDYAIDHLPDRAVFSIFRRSSEMPLFRVEKNPKLARRQGAYSVIAQTGMILKRGSELARVLRVIDKSRFSIAE